MISEYERLNAWLFDAAQRAPGDEWRRIADFGRVTNEILRRRDRALFLSISANIGLVFALAITLTRAAG